MKKTTEADRLTFRKALLIFTFAQVIFAFLLFIVTSMQLWLSVVLALILAGTAFLAVKLKQKGRGARVATRLIYIIVPALALALVLIQLIFQLIMNRHLYEHGPVLQQILETALFLLRTLFFDCVLFAVPAVALCARAERLFDIMMLRIYSIIVFLLSLVICFFGGYNPVVFSVTHVLPRILFCVCTVCTVLLVYISYPPKRWPFQKKFAALQKTRENSDPADEQEKQVLEK